MRSRKNQEYVTLPDLLSRKNQDYVALPALLKRIDAKLKWIDRFLDWHIERCESKDIKNYLREYLENVIPDEDKVEKILSKLTDEELRVWYRHAYRNVICKMKPKNAVREMNDWGFELEEVN